MGGLQVLRVPKNETVAGMIAKYQASGLVEFAEPDYLVHACAVQYSVIGTPSTYSITNHGVPSGSASAS